MSQISSPIQDMLPEYDVIVVGSGYGGGVAASRLARAGKRVCLLERGKEWLAGDFPDKEAEVFSEIQIDLADKHIGSRTALFDVRGNDDINVVVGCGLGGTSLINANVSLRADPRVFNSNDWPKGLLDDVDTLLNEGYEHAERMLRPVTYPENQPRLAKQEAHRASSANVTGEFALTPINVNFESLPNDTNHVGVTQKPCIHCGDCVSGCNHHAKSTTLMNYLPDAWNHGADIFTEVSARFVDRAGDDWLVHFQAVASGQERFDAPTQFVKAGVVVLAAGTLGTAEILLRSKARGLAMSEQVGQHFSGNGDALGFGYNNDYEINAIGFGSDSIDGREHVGACITSVIDSRKAGNYEAGMVIEEGSFPGAIASALPATMAAAAEAVGRDTGKDFGDRLKAATRRLASVMGGPHRGATRNTQVYLVMAHDDADGRMFLQDDRLRVGWPGVGKKDVFKRASQGMEKATEALGGTYVRNPIWTKLFDHDLVTVHPLGGAVMGEDATAGAVNHKGQVFAGSAGGDVYTGLYVGDGAIMPRSLGVNPLLTISAIAERNCKLIAQDRGWIIDYKLPSAPSESRRNRKPGIRFTEAMRGWFSTQNKDDYKKAAEIGKQSNLPFEFVLTIASTDVEALLSDPQHRATMAGTVVAPALSADPLSVTDGVFNLFSSDPDQVGVRNMMYNMRLLATDGKSYFFNGFKVVRDDKGLDIWPDTTTLFITLYEGEDDQGNVLGKGILEIRPDDFLKQMTTMTITGARDAALRLKWLTKFAAFFGDTVFQTYGGIFSRDRVFDPDAPPRPKRPLNVGSPQLHPFKTKDGMELLLTRYNGGGKGPVMLSHGLGVSSRIFSTDTIDTNLLEYLFAHEYDVWLLDFRSSVELQASKTQHTGDDIATKDYPAAVALIQQITGKTDIQVVAHCFGSTTFFMAMLAGLQGVRSAVISQIATHIEAPAITRLKSGLHVPSLLDDLGIDSLTAYVDTHAQWHDQLYDKALELFPMEKEEQCNSRTCHRITFMYSLLYEHSQLNQVTHDTLHEMFGVANVDSLKHLSLLVRKGHLVDANGEEAYMPHLGRLAIPMRILHGAENACFKPVSTERTLEAMQQVNDPALYDRFVIPNYGHIDCIYGKNAAQDVYPKILEHLEKSA